MVYYVIITSKICLLVVYIVIILWNMHYSHVIIRFFIAYRGMIITTLFMKLICYNLNILLDLYMIILSWKFAWWHTKKNSLKHYFRRSGISTITNVSQDISFDIGICRFKGPKQRRHSVFDVWMKRLVYTGRTLLNVGNCYLMKTSYFISIWHACFYWLRHVSCIIFLHILGL